jgi:hypothetical protein
MKGNLLGTAVRLARADVLVAVGRLELPTYAL